MTTPAAEKLYLQQHLVNVEGLLVAIFNPKKKGMDELPFIYGFNNGGSRGWFDAQLIAEDGTWLGSHICSDEAYMPSDLGILEGTRPDRHETFRAHYPDGYRMEFLTYDEAGTHPGLNQAFKRSEENEQA